MSLDQKLTSRYNLFQVASGNRLGKFQSDEVESRIPDRSKAVSTVDSTANIHETEIEIV